MQSVQNLKNRPR